MLKCPSPALFATWLASAAGVIAIDQASKAAVLAYLQKGDVIPVTSFFDLVLAFNSGAAFSFLATHNGWQRWVFAVLALGVSAWIVTQLWQFPRQKGMSFALSFIMGGALGNVIDRFVHGAVVDFLYFHITLEGKTYGWPAFNAADSAIFLGVVLMLIFQLKSAKPPA